MNATAANLIRTDIVNATDNPERLVCQCARGDHYDGYVGDTEFEALMEPIEYTQTDISAVTDVREIDDVDNLELEAKIYHLLKDLFVPGHWGVFEHPQLTLAVTNVSRSCMAQVTRHRPVTYDVQSQRYVNFAEKETPVKIPRSFLDPDHATRGEGEIDVDEATMEQFRDRYEDLASECLEFYEDAVDAGFPKEDARFGLQIGTTVNWTMSMNARTMLHLANVRGKGNAQWEAQALADAIVDSLDEWMPYTAHLWEIHGDFRLTP